MGQICGLAAKLIKRTPDVEDPFVVDAPRVQVLEKVNSDPGHGTMRIQVLGLSPEGRVERSTADRSTLQIRVEWVALSRRFISPIWTCFSAAPIFNVHQHPFALPRVRNVEYYTTSFVRLEFALS